MEMLEACAGWIAAAGIGLVFAMSQRTINKLEEQVRQLYANERALRDRHLQDLEYLEAELGRIVRGHDKASRDSVARPSHSS